MAWNEGSVLSRPAQTPNLDLILATIRQLESGSARGNYQAKNKGSTASGAYQFLDTTWIALAPKTAKGQPLYLRAADAPPNVQDQVARDYVLRILQSNGGDIASVPQTWYVGTTKYGPNSGYVPPGNRLSVGQYVADWMRIYNVQGGQGSTGFGPGNEQTAITNEAGYPNVGDEHCLIGPTPEIVMPSKIPNIPPICFLSTNKARAIGGAVLLGLGGIVILTGLSLLAFGEMKLPGVPGAGFIQAGAESRAFRRAEAQGVENQRNAPRTSAGGRSMLGRTSEPFPED